jgi:pimeloyl-ACP methyl ester carboxylesterase
MPLIIFAHANSFPASTYRVMFKSLRARGFTVKAIDKLGHDAAYPITNNWPHLAKQLADFGRAEIEAAGQPAWLVGHSLGGLLSLMLAARHPDLGGHGVQGLVLLDAPLVSGWKAGALQLAKAGPFIDRFSPARISNTRRTSWPSRDAALAHFAGKKAFARWDPRVLADYIDHGMAADPKTGQWALCFEREVESRIYNTVPDNLEALLRRHPLHCPLHFIGGESSRELKQVGMDLTERLVHRSGGSLTMAPGSHLFPMEQPVETASKIQEIVKSASSATGGGQPRARTASN